MASRASFTFNDFSGEKSTMAMRITDLTAGNVAAETAKVAALLAAITPIVLGTTNHYKVQWSETQHDNTLPSDENAKRENKWLIRFQDNVNGKLGTLELPTAEDATHMIDNSDVVDLDNGEVSAFVTALEAIMKSVDGNAVTVLKITSVGRNL